MKMALIALIALSSVSTFAAPKQSEFERGYEAGKLTCQSESAWVCQPVFEGVTSAMSAVGLTRGSAIENLYQGCVSYRFVACYQAIAAGKVACKKI